MKRIAVSLGSLAVLAFTACGPRERTRTPTVPAAPSCVRDDKRPVPAPLLDELAILATTFPRSSKDAATVVTEAELDRYIDDLLNDDRFARNVAPRMLVPYLIQYSGTEEYNQELAVDDASGTPVYFLPHQGKCKPKEAVDVHPWWALDTTVKVCPLAYQPTHLAVEPEHLLCGVMLNKYCGCGPNLAFCVRDGEQHGAILAAERSEIASTVARVVKADEPVDEIFLANETERDRYVEFVYRRWRISAGEPADAVLAGFKEWPEKPVLAPRHESVPRQHAGVLTGAGTLAIESSIRARMKWFYDALWCDEPPSGSVKTDAVLALKAKNLRVGEGWQELAARPVCTECHARLDYGGEFFKGFLTNFGYDPREHLTGRGKLFGANIDDARGEAQLDPRSFAELAMAQPEFSVCMVKDVKRHVLDDAWDTTADDALRTAFQERHSLKATMRAALRIHAQRRLKASCAPPAAKPAALPADVPKSLEATLETYCGTCHGPSRKPDFTDLTDKETLGRALEAVSFGKMPKDPVSMPSSERRRLTELLIERRWSDEGARAEARAYFEQRQPSHVHPVVSTFNAVDSRSGAKPRARRFDSVDESTTRADRLRYTPGVSVLIGLEALDACKASGATGLELEACMRRATDVTTTTRQPED